MTLNLSQLSEGGRARSKTRCGIAESTRHRWAFEALEERMLLALVTFDPAAYTGGYNPAGQGFVTGLSSFDLAPATYNLQIGNSSPFTFSVDPSGNVSSDNPVAASATGNTLTFNTTTVNVDPAGFSPASYRLSQITAQIVGPDSFVLVPNINNYVILPGNSSGFSFDVDASGNVSSDNAVAASATGNTLTFNTTIVNVDPAGFSPGSYRLSQITAQIVGPDSFVLVPNINNYVILPGNSSGFTFDVDASGNVSSDNPVAASAAGNTLTFNTTTVIVDPDGFTGQFRLSQISGNASGPQTFDLVPNILNYVVVVDNSTTFNFDVGPNGQPDPPSVPVTVGGDTFTFLLSAVTCGLTVTTLSDGGAGSLREAISCGNSTPGPNTIDFAVAGTINLLSDLPDLSDPTGGTLIDGTTAPGYSGAPLLVLKGKGAAGGTGIDQGLRITSATNEVRALQIVSFRVGVVIVSLGGGSASGNIIVGSYIGNDGTIAVPNIHGIEVKAPNNRIGTNGDGIDDASERNVISGNLSIGVEISGNSAAGNVVAGNLIGTDAAGTAPLGNGDIASPSEGAGIRIISGATNNRVGTNGDGLSDTTERNIISGNAKHGIYLSASDNVVAGNFVGTDLSGTLALGNGTAGSSFFGIFEGGNNNRLGTNGDGIADGAERNIISGNANGVRLAGSNSVLAGNYIGTDVLGTSSLGNSSLAVRTLFGSSQRIGTDGNGIADAAERNVISGNGNGVRIENDGVILAGNFIGTDATGSVALVNTGDGILIASGSGVRIGTDANGVADSAERNIISGNQAGIKISSGSGHVVAGNHIGLNASGTLSLGNGTGIVQGGGQVRIGTNSDGVNDDAERNIISGNSHDGVYLSDSTGTIIAGNYIGTQANGIGPLGNTANGILLGRSANSQIGGAISTSANTIAFNGGAGILALGNSTSTGNDISGNAIFLNGGLGIDLSNSFTADGVTLNDAGDGDAGPNNLQNFPFLTSLSTTPSSTTINGTLNSAPNSDFRLDFFSNATSDPSGFGEGEEFIGSTIVTTNGNGDVSFTVTFPISTPENYFITATSTDALGNTSEFSGAIQFVSNQPPTAEAGGPYSGDEGAAIALSSATASDPDSDPLTLSWSVDTSPTSATCTFSDASALNPDLTCDDNGTFTVTLTADDGTAAPVSSDATVTVNNVAPFVGPVSVPVDPININNMPVSAVSAPYSDPGMNDTHTCTVDYGDGTAPQTGTATGGTCTDPAGHTYTAAGVYEVTVEVTDDDLDGGSATASEFIVIYDADGGFVTGGGWIDSPEGACPVFCNDATGKANFGFVSKYKNGASVPTGQTEFNFKAGDLNFNSTSYDWLVIAGKKAMYKGDGTVNGDAGFTFQLNAIDGDLPGGDGIDKFRIKIKETGVGVIYDNQVGETDPNADPTTTLGGGNIKIHKQNNLLVEAAGQLESRGTTLTQAMLDAAVTQAIVFWTQQGVPADSLSALGQVKIGMGELVGSIVGTASETSNVIRIDRDAGGYGWASHPGSDGVDLLSAVIHEFGHFLGLDHAVLGSTLEIGQRRLPVLATPGDADRDGVFDRLDLIAVLQSGKYLMDQPATWSEGDWNHDGRFDQLDIVAASQAGRYFPTTEADEVFTIWPVKPGDNCCF